MLPITLLAQTKISNSGWFVLNNASKISNKFSVSIDVQLRTEDHWSYLKQTEVSTGVSYNLRASQDIGAGVSIQASRPDQLSSAQVNDLRIFEQYTLRHSLGSIGILHRFRLEQRFIESVMKNDGNEHENIFAQRLRYRLRLIEPIIKQTGDFNKGPFVVLQNEVFLNVQNRKKLNGGLFDQNRLLLAGGYRVSKKLDIEAGYLNAFILGSKIDNVNHIFQFALMTRL